MDALGVREREVLDTLVDVYIRDGEPVGSRTISQESRLGVSSATIRNTMVGLEGRGYIRQPHTSAGRIPTDTGYRFYVDHLMATEPLASAEKRGVASRLRETAREGDIEAILTQVAKVLGEISHQLGIVLTPQFDVGVLERLELVRLTSQKVILALALRSGLVKTIVMQVDHSISERALVETSRTLNLRLAGLTVGEIRRSIRERVRGAAGGDSSLLQIIVDRAKGLFAFDAPQASVFVGKATHIFTQPEFSDPDRLGALVDLIEERNVLAEALRPRPSGLSITIGAEHTSERLRPLAVVVATYAVGDLQGALGVVGPTRMPYPRVAALVSYVAEVAGSMINA
jgi:heat-inducible transcriptional repressor